MNERILLLISATTGLLGIIGLLFINTLPPTTTLGTLTWTNETSALVITTQPQWVELTEPTRISTGTCVELTGVPANNRITHATLKQAAAHEVRNCP